MTQSLGLLSDVEIWQAGIVENAVPQLVQTLNNEKIISYGMSSYGYDLRLDTTLIVYQAPAGVFPPVIDPKLGLDPKLMQTHVLEPHKPFYLPAHSFAIGNSIERLTMPVDVTGIALGKSTYARCGLVVNCTPAEAGWEGYLTLELSNTTDFPIALYAGEGITQILFFRGNPPSVTYLGRRGKYQDQPKAPIGPKV